MQTYERNTSKKPGAEKPSAPGFLRRMCAVVYDALLLLAVLFFAAAIALPFNSGQAFTAGQYYFPLYLFGISYLFYAWFWTHGGQTLGLRAWKIKLCNLDGSGIGWRRASLRFFAAILSWAFLGLGFLWCLFDKNRLSWHDHLSKTRPYFMPGENNRRPN
ncbi:RDD family protein [Methylomonas sp. LL1]|uniref:RDD family protein n=1 Tax=Methylomonas sp. LL1 TaxID=2785785 RepID=UPI0018C3874C|nr:RDD family protein [Methylomonas sp. LL1]QPK62201.1 RDD family protein [Methylomonas sp. LL1]